VVFQRLTTYRKSGRLLILRDDVCYQALRATVDSRVWLSAFPSLDPRWNPSVADRPHHCAL